MGFSCDAHICYGYNFGREPRFPWNDYSSQFMRKTLEEFGDDVDDFCEEELHELWWVYIKDVDLQKHVNKSYEKRRQWFLDNPCPFEMTHNGYEYMLCVPGSEIYACGEPEKLTKEKLSVDWAAEMNFIDALRRYNIHSCEVGPSWLLYSVYG